MRGYRTSTYLGITGQRERGFQTTPEGNEDELYPYAPFGSDREKNIAAAVWDFLTGWIYSR